MSKGKRGRPIGGKHPEVIREYWRIMQQIHRTVVGTKKDKK